MICVVDASVAVKWFVEGDWALREDHVEPALEILGASTRGALEFFQPPHFLAEVAAVFARDFLGSDTKFSQPKADPSGATHGVAEKLVSDPNKSRQYVDDLAALNITWAEPTVAYSRAIELACQLNHHLFDTLYHALALTTPGAVLVTADRRYFDKAQHLGQIAWLPDFHID